MSIARLLSLPTLIVNRWKGTRCSVLVAIGDGLSDHGCFSNTCDVLKQVYGPEASMTGICKSAIDYISVAA